MHCSQNLRACCQHAGTAAKQCSAAGERSQACVSRRPGSAGRTHCPLASMPVDLPLRQTTREEIGSLGAQQLYALATLLDALSQAQGWGWSKDVLTEFARQVAVPEAVLPWLATVTEALLILPEQEMQPG